VNELLVHYDEDESSTPKVINTQKETPKKKPNEYSSLDSISNNKGDNEIRAQKDDILKR